MLESKLCPECGVPEYITKEHAWLGNGDIVQGREQWHRMVFIECENLDPFFHGIEEILGMSIEPMIITVHRTAVRTYLSQFIPEETKELVRMKRIPLQPLASAIGDIARMLGFGSYKVVDMRYELDDDDYYTACVTEPFSLPMATASLAASIEVLTGRDQGVTYVEVSPGTYHITAFPHEHPKELKLSLWLSYYYHHGGDLELEKCEACGAPKALSEYRWHLERGVIASGVTRRRMVIIGWQNLEPIFENLEADLGETIPRVVVEAQRRFTASGFYPVQDILDTRSFRNQLALRGLGYLKELTTKKTGMRMRVDNVALPLIIVGLAQGLFELAFGVGTTVEWELSKDRVLEMEVASIQ